MELSVVSHAGGDDDGVFADILMTDGEIQLGVMFDVCSFLERSPKVNAKPVDFTSVDVRSGLETLLTKATTSVFNLSLYILTERLQIFLSIFLNTLLVWPLPRHSRKVLHRPAK